MCSPHLRLSHSQRGQATPVRFHNKLIRGSLQIVKVDHDGTTPLEGAKYQITDVDGNIVATETTDKKRKNHSE